MYKRMMRAGVLTACLTFGTQAGLNGGVIAKKATVGGASPVSLISGNTCLGVLYFNNLTTNNAHFGGPAVAVVIGSNLLGSYALNNGGLGGSPTYNGASIVVVYALFGTVAPGNTNVFRATGGRVALFTTPIYVPSALVTWGATNATGTSLSTPIAVWDLRPADSVSDPGEVSGGGGLGLFNLASARVNQISVNSTVSTANQGFFSFRESLSFPAATLAGNNFITVTGNLPLVPADSVFIDEGLITRTDGSLLVATESNTVGLGGGGITALNTIAYALGGFGSPNNAFATAFGGIGSASGPASSFNPSSGAMQPNTADAIYTFGVSASPTVHFAQ